MATIFSKIVAGEIPSYKVAEDENNYAFLDINPVAPGHTLVIPKREVDYLFDLTDEVYVDLQLFAKRVATAIKQTMPCQRVGVAVMGLEVPHAHIHLIPINEEKDMNFFKVSYHIRNHTVCVTVFQNHNFAFAIAFDCGVARVTACKHSVFITYIQLFFFVNAVCTAVYNNISFNVNIA